MAYVPGCEIDVFISYSHADNGTDWVTNFEKSLEDRLNVLLGAQVKVWRDARNLGGEQDLTQEVQRSLSASATMIAIVSPSYLNSSFCRSEREYFIDQMGNEIMVGTRFKVLKVIKLPAEHDLHRQILPDLVGFPFYIEDSMRGPIECFPGDRDFVLKVDLLAKSTANLLRELHNSKTPIYIAEPTPEEKVWNYLRAELECKGFRVLPRYRLAGTKDDETEEISGIQESVVTVHLFGKEYREHAFRQLRASRNHKKPIVVWTPPNSNFEERLLEFIEQTGDDSLTTILTTDPWKDLVRTTIERANASNSVLRDSATSTLEIYLVCDRTDTVETNGASRLADRIRHALPNAKVILPEVDRDPALLKQKHQERLARCEAILIYVHQASREWLREFYQDILRAERGIRRGVPFKSCAVVLDYGDKFVLEPEIDKDTSDLVESGVIHQVLKLQDQGLTCLEPFLKPLQKAASAAGGTS